MELLPTHKGVLWFGREVEGHRHRGKRTAFVAAQVPDAQLFRVTACTIEHVYLTAWFDDLSWFESVLLPRLAASVAVTIARRPTSTAIREVLSKPWADRVDLVVLLSDIEWLLLLRLRDQISLCSDYNVRMFDMSSAAITHKEDFAHDIPIEVLCNDSSCL